MKKIFQYLLVLFLIFIGTIGVAKEVYNSYLIIEGQRWKPYTAKVNSARIKQVNGKGGSNYYRQIEYEFVYNHEIIKGNTFSLTPHSFTIKKRKEYLQQYRKNTKIEVYMNFNNPQHSSVMKPRLSYLFYELFLLMMSILIIGIGTFLGGYNYFHHPKQTKTTYNAPQKLDQ